MKVLMLPRYTRLGASSRLRMLQYAPLLEAEGISVAQAPFFDEAYLTRLYAGRPTAGSAMRAFLRRIRDLRRQGAADLVWLEKEALPWLPWPVERLLGATRAPVVVDYDDAVFHRYDRHESAAVRRVLGRKIDRVMAHAAAVTAGNEYLADRARLAGAQRVEPVPTVVDTARYHPREAPGPDAQPVIGWIGSPSTWTEFGAPLLRLLAEVVARHGAAFHAIGAPAPARPPPGFAFLPWYEETEIDRIRALDIGIMPLSDTPWARGKCGYKLIQYMACGLPVVASPVGVNRTIVEDGVNGFLAETDAEWHAALGRLLADPDLRRRMGAAGRRKVETDYALDRQGPRLAALFREIGGTGGGR